MIIIWGVIIKVELTEALGQEGDTCPSGQRVA